MAETEDYFWIVAARTSSMDHLLKEMSDGFDQGTLAAWCEVYTTAYNAIKRRFLEERSRNWKGSPEPIPPSGGDFIWHNWSSSWASMEDASAFWNEWPPSPVQGRLELTTVHLGFASPCLQILPGLASHIPPPRYQEDAVN